MTGQAERGPVAIDLVLWLNSKHNLLQKAIRKFSCKIVHGNINITHAFVYLSKLHNIRICTESLTGFLLNSVYIIIYILTGLFSEIKIYAGLIIVW